MRIMCDTNVLVRGVINPFGAAAKLLSIIASQHSLVTSPPILAELYDVLRRHRIRVLHRMNDQQIRRVISRLYKLAVVVPVPIDLPTLVPRDPKDNAVVVTAIAGKAAVLCTLDGHLFDPAVVGFCADHGVRVMRDADFLAELQAS